jgi:hypothetical protein
MPPGMQGELSEAPSLPPDRVRTPSATCSIFQEAFYRFVSGWEIAPTDPRSSTGLLPTGLQVTRLVVPT